MNWGPYGLEGRAALVTGAGGGLGEGICLALAAGGAAVACLDRRSDAAERVAGLVGEAGGRAVTIEGDISDAVSVESTTGRAAAELGGLDILVNNAAIYPRRDWTEISPEEWDEVLGINLRGYFLCSRAAYPFLKESGRGRIINLASLTFFIGLGYLLDYVSSKGGVIGFTRALAREVGADGVTVNAIAPGAFPTDAEKIHPNPEEYAKWVLDQQSIKRRGRPEDIGNLVVFLAGDASAFITGQTIVIDGGWARH